MQSRLGYACPSSVLGPLAIGSGLSCLRGRYLKGYLSLTSLQGYGGSQAGGGNPTGADVPHHSHTQSPLPSGEQRLYP